MLKVIPMLLLVLCLSAESAFADEEETEDHICFRTIDMNSDEIVTPGEFAAYYNIDLFAAVDKDQDGLLTHDEYHVYLGHGAQ